MYTLKAQNGEVGLAKSSIFTVGFELPSSDFEYVDFDSNQTLLDADICVFQPTLGPVSYDYSGYQGHSLLDKSSSVDFKKNGSHWRNEIVSAAAAGKLVVVFMVAPIECYYSTGERQTSGTGRSQSRTDIVNPCSSYDAIPNLARVTAKKGTSIRLATDTSFFKSYWSKFQIIVFTRQNSKAKIPNRFLQREWAIGL